MNVLSLFDGMSCGFESLKSEGFSIENYYSSEINQYSIKIAEKNNPSLIKLGDVEGWRFWRIDWTRIDLVLAGSPCQGFSYAGDGLNFNDQRSRLFFVFVDILNHIKMKNPNVKFLLENVKMRQNWVDRISNILQCKPVEINSKNFGAQERKRIYWFNWQANVNSLNNKTLGDVLQADVEKKYFISEKALAGFENRKQNNINRGAGFGHNITPLNQKTKTIVARYYKDGKECLFCDKGRIRKLTPVEVERLFNLPDNYTLGASDARRYEMLGNGWDKAVICAIFKGLKQCTN